MRYITEILKQGLLTQPCPEQLRRANHVMQHINRPAGERMSSDSRYYNIESCRHGDLKCVICQREVVLVNLNNEITQIIFYCMQTNPNTTS